MAAPPLLFAYGTLREPAVQRAVFGRELAGTPDAIVGFEVGGITLDGVAYPILRRAADPAGEVAGVALEIEPADLVSADAYEGPAYRRAAVALASGRRAFAYLDAAQE